jgi:hypothetical protein
MTYLDRGFAAVLLLLLPYCAQAESRAEAMQRRMQNARAQFADQSAEASEQGQSAMAKLSTDMSSSLLRCDAPLAPNADIYQQLAWAESADACLGVLESSLQVRQMTPDTSVQQSAFLSREQLAALRLGVQDVAEDARGQIDFMDMSWGVGVGYSHGFDDIVDSAEIRDGVVRVTKDLTEQPRVVLEFHSYRWCHRKGTDGKPIETGCGPFAAVAASGDQIAGVGAGWMYGWRTGTGEKAEGWSVGIGVILDSGGKELGPGYNEGQPPPDGAQDVFLKEKSVLSALIFFTRTF